MYINRPSTNHIHHFSLTVNIPSSSTDPMPPIEGGRPCVGVVRGGDKGLIPNEKTGTADGSSWNKPDTFTETWLISSQNVEDVQHFPARHFWIFVARVSDCAHPPLPHLPWHQLKKATTSDSSTVYHQTSFMAKIHVDHKAMYYLYVLESHRPTAQKQPL